MISSKISSTSCLSQVARSSRKYAGWGTANPAEETEMGSTITAATVSGSSASMVRSRSRALARAHASSVGAVPSTPARSRKAWGGWWCRKPGMRGSKTLLRSQLPVAERAPMVPPW